MRFDTRFDNHERDDLSSPAVSSQTLFSSRLVPSVGISWGHHRIMAGGSFTLDFNVHPSYSTEIEPLVFYNFSTSRWDVFAGRFERRHLLGSYSRATYSGIASFYDNLLDGVALQLHSPGGLLEVALDWDGTQSEGERESFRVLSAGQLSSSRARSLRWFEVGYSLELYHLASRPLMHDGVVDHITGEVWIGAALETVFPWFERLGLRVGNLSMFDRDRSLNGEWLSPRGLTLDFAVQKWRIGIRNRTYSGDPLMPLWGIYGNRVYRGDPLYAGADFYNYTQFYWSPRLGRGVSLSLEAGFHFDGDNIGFQQLGSIGITFDREFFKK